MPKVVSIHSYRGGTGKSNFTANLATTVAMLGNRVGVVDTDIQSPGIHNLFGLEPERMEKTLNNYLWGQAAIEDTAYDVSANFDLHSDGKIFLVPSSVKADDISRILSEGSDTSRMTDNPELIQDDRTTQFKVASQFNSGGCFSLSFLSHRLV
ncbi:MAG TPA: P-loop NTPase [Allocoleopsis sp.]